MRGGVWKGICLAGARGALPVSYTHLVSAARHYFVMKRRRAQNTVTVKRVQDGYLMTLTIADVGSDLLSMTILLPDEQSCDLVKRRFLNDPVVIYKGVVALLTGSYENVGALLEPAEDLPRG